MTDGRNDTDIEQLRRANVALEQRLAALRAMVQEKARAEQALHAGRAREAHIKQVLLAIRNVNQLIVQESDPQRLIDRACATLTETLGYHAAWIVLLPQDHLSAPMAAVSGADPALGAFRRNLLRGELSPCMRLALDTDERVRMDAPLDTCVGCALGDVYDGGRLVRRLAFGGRVYGVMSVALPLDLVHDEEEGALFAEVAGDLAFALNKIALEARRESLEREQAELLRSMADPFAVYRSVLDEAGRLVSYRFEYLNAAYERTTGVTLEAVRGKTIDEVWPATDPIWRENYRPVVESGETRTFEMYDAVVGRHFRCTAYRPWDTPDRFCVLFADVTERVLAEAALRHSEERFRGIAEKLTDVIFVTDARGIIKYVSPAVQAIFGCAPQEMVGTHLSDHLDPASADVALAGFAAVANEGAQVHNLALSLRRRDGSIFIGELSASPFLLDGEIGTLGVARDVTERIHAEQELERNRILLRTVIDLLPDAIFAKDAAGRKVLSNRADLALMGARDEAEVLGRTDAETYSPELVARFGANDRVVLQEGRAIIDDELLLDTPDGRPRWLLVSKVPLRDETGEIVGLVGIGHDITERRLAEQESERNRALLRTVIDLLPEAVFARDLGGRKILSNRADRAILGATEEAEVLGKTDADFYAPDVAAYLRASDRAVIEKGGPILDVESYVALSDGDPRWWLVSKVPLRDESGAIIGLVGVTRDVTARKLVEQESERNRALLRTVIDLLPDAVYVKDAQARKVLVNRADLANIEADDEAEVLGKTDLELFSPDVAARFYADDMAVLRGGHAVRQHEELLVSPSGEQRWLLTSKVPLRDAAGEVVGIVGIGHDITARKLAEQESERNRTLLRTVIDLLPTAVYVKDAEGRKILANRVDLEHCGHDESRVLGKTDLELYPPEMAARSFADDMAVIREGRSILNREEWIYSSAGSPLYALTTKVPLRDESGRIIGLVGIGLDITERKRAEEALRYVNADLSKAQEVANLGTWRWDIASDRLEWSEQMYRVFGLPPGGDPGRATDIVAQNIHPDDRDAVHRWNLAARAGHIPPPLEYRLVRPGGETRVIWGEVGEVILDADGHPAAVTGIAQDVTAQRSAEEALRESEVHFRTLANSGQALVWTSGLDKKCNYFNQPWLDFTGRALDQELGDGWAEGVHPDDLAQCIATYVAAFDRREPFSMRYRLRRHDGEYRWVQDDGSPRYDSRGEFLGYIGHCLDVTEQMRTSETLRQRESMLQRIFDILPVGLWFADKDGTLLRGNPAGVAIWGAEPHVSPADYGVFKARRLPSGEEIAADDWALAHTVREGVTIVDELLEIDALDGQKRVVVNYTAPVFDDEGAVQAAIVVNQDVTDFVRAEQALRESEERWRSYVEHAPYGVFIADGQARYLQANPAACRITGYRVDELQAMSISDLVPRQARSEALASFGGLLRDGHYHGELPFVRKDGVERWWSVAAVLLSDDRALGFVEDITARRETEAALQESERNYRTFIDSTTDMVFVKDQAFRYALINEAQRAFFGRPVEQIVGRTDFELMSEQMAQACRRSDQQALTQGTVVVSEEQVGERVFETRKFPVTLPDGVGVGGYIRDVTAAVRAAQETARLEEQLRQAQKMESVGRLAGGVAHDFNNMLGVILGHAELALEQTAREAPLHDDLREIQRAAQRSADLTRQLLAFARKQTVAPRILDLNDTVAGMLKMLRRLIGEDVDLAWMPGANLWPVKIDPAQIDQLLANLCVNARDAIAGTGKLTIETANLSFDEAYCADHLDASPGDYVMLAVSDDGCGMDKETLAHLFEPFFTTKGIGQGTGLGLATVHGIVRQNAGLINVYSEPDRGTTFRIYLPRSVEAGPRPVEPHRDVAASAGETVLLVEDEPAILNMSKTMLERIGYRVLAAATPAEALRLAEAHPDAIDLLMTDVVMPDMNGRDLANALRTLYPDLKCLFMSGYTANVIAHRGVLDEGVNFIQKPFSLRDLAAQLRQALSRS